MAAPLSGAAGGLSFNRDIRPILSDKCIGCHGPDAAHREAGLRLDVPEGAFAPLQESEGFAVVAGKPEKSAILQRIDSKDEDELMPPPKTHKTVNAAERALLERWIREGAAYEPHWSYAPLKRPQVPTVQGRSANPIDAFILADLEKRGIQPSPPAAPNELLRRIHLDLTGLPPDPAALDGFERDPASYPKVVESLLASPRYGEHMAVPWLNAVRFADTVGFHGDQNVRIFAFRDYVIRSFQENKPYDVFVQEQLAGDLLPDATPEQLVASGFNRLNLMTREGGAQPKEYLAKSAADRVRAVGTAFLGQTTGCAECHDHKYDPITARNTDQATAGLIRDLELHGLLEDTLVIWGGEFGRTPMGQGSGRDHHINAFSILMAGGGVNGGTTFGKTDDLGYGVVEGRSTVHDLHATMLHLCGIDDSAFTYKYQGLDFKLSGVEPARVMKEILG